MVKSETVHAGVKASGLIRESKKPRLVGHMLIRKKQ
jgi:hypothetical protein